MFKPKTKNIGFYIMLSLAGLAVVYLFWPFWELLGVAVILTMLFFPMYRHLEGVTKSPNLSAGFVVFVMAAIITGPVLLIGQQLFYEVVDLYKNLHLENLSSTGGLITRLPLSLQHLAQSLNLDLQASLTQFTSNIVSSFSTLISSVGWFFGSLVVVAFSVFFLLRDGAKIKKLLSDVLPLSQANENILFQKIDRAVSGVVKGQFMIALIQASASFVGFWIFGVPKALLWGCFVLLAAFVPTFGTGLVLIPAVVYLYLTGHVGNSIGMLIWAWACVGLIDNVLAAKLVSSKVRLHPLLTIFAILGGVEVFGVLGVLFGPILVAIFVALVEISRNDLS